jgi:hypothetical protein
MRAQQHAYAPVIGLSVKDWRRDGELMMTLKILLSTIIVFWFVGTCGAEPKHNKYRDEPIAGYTFYTSHGTIVGAKPVHNW